MASSPAVRARRGWPTRLGRRSRGGTLLLLGLGLLGAACSKGPSLSKIEEDEPAVDLGPVSPDGPRLGAVADRTPVYAAPSKSAKELGYLHAGATVPRSEKSWESSDCIDGWYQIAPRGFVCTEKVATTDLAHPTLLAMALGPKLDDKLPYVYARTTKVTSLFNRTQEKERGVELGGRLAKSTVLAIVGSWTAPDESNEPQLLGLRMNGQFVRAEDLEASAGSAFSGSVLDETTKLPLAYVVRQGVRRWTLDGTAEKKGELKYHERILLTGRYRTVEGEQFWATESDEWVRHKDVTILRARHEFPEFVTDGQKWLDVSVITGTAIAYEGKTPVFATLVSVGRDRLGDPKTSASTEMGTFQIVSKHITRRTTEEQAAALHDAPWALELSSGQWLLSSPRHDRFGIEHTDGDIEVSPADGAHLWKWATPEVPEGWHGARLTDETPTFVVVRK